MCVCPQRWPAGVPALLHPSPPAAEHDAGLPGEPAGVGSDSAVGAGVSLLDAHLRPIPRQRRSEPLSTDCSDTRTHTNKSMQCFISFCFHIPAGSEYRLRELCKELLGPVHKSAATAWEPTTLVRQQHCSVVINVDKHVLYNMCINQSNFTHKDHIQSVK